MSAKLPPKPRLVFPTFRHYAIVEKCRCGAEIHRPAEIGKECQIVCATCRARRVMTIIAARHLMLGGIIALAACGAPAYSPAPRHGPGYAEAYPQYEPVMRIERGNLAAEREDAVLHQGDTGTGTCQ